MIVLVPSTIALLPSYSSLEDPVAELRVACLAAVGRLVADDPEAVSVLCAPLTPANAERGAEEAAGLRIARHLLAEVGWSGPLHAEPPSDVSRPVLVVANGSGRRSDKAPGHLDERAGAFDDSLERALRSGDTAALGAVDASLAEQLWCHDATAFHALAGVLAPGATGEVTYSADPYGVQYWVVVWR